jgi:hypothetical protein
MRQIITASLVALACTLALPAGAQSARVVVPVEKAPFHLPIFKNDLVMLLNVYQPPGSGKGAQIYHTHSRDQISVLVQAADMGGADEHGTAREVRRGTRGAANYTAFSKKPMTHRGENAGTTTFQNIVVALMYPEPGRFTPGSRANVAGYTQIMDNDRVRGWRLVLEPGQSAAITQAAPGLRVVVDGGDLVRATRRAARGMHVRLGDFFWRDAGTTARCATAGPLSSLIEFSSSETSSERRHVPCESANRGGHPMRPCSQHHSLSVLAHSHTLRRPSGEPVAVPIDASTTGRCSRTMDGAPRPLPARRAQATTPTRPISSASSSTSATTRTSFLARATPPRPPTRGNVGYTAYSKKSMTHRSTNLGSIPFHNVVVSLNYPEPGRFTAGLRTDVPGYQQVLDNERVRGWRLILEPGQSVAAITQTAPGIRIVVDDGEITESAPGKVDRGQGLRSGDFYWQDGGETRAVRDTAPRALRSSNSTK